VVQRLLGHAHISSTVGYTNSQKLHQTGL